jgi:hypothetical protein
MVRYIPVTQFKNGITLHAPHGAGWRKDVAACGVWRLLVLAGRRKASLSPFRHSGSKQPPLSYFKVVIINVEMLLILFSREYSSPRGR